MEVPVQGAFLPAWRQDHFQEIGAQNKNRNKDKIPAKCDRNVFIFYFDTVLKFTLPFLVFEIVLS